VDEPSEIALWSALELWGETPVIVRTANRKFLCYYFLGKDGPFDVLGGRLAVAAPSQGPLGEYEFIQAGLDDLDRP
jgi:hypothetical protein